jgi:hypothetical protein
MGSTCLHNDDRHDNEPRTYAYLITAHLAQTGQACIMREADQHPETLRANEDAALKRPLYFPINGISIGCYPLTQSCRAY